MKTLLLASLAGATLAAGFEVKDCPEGSTWTKPLAWGNSPVPKGFGIYGHMAGRWGNGLPATPDKDVGKFSWYCKYAADAGNNEAAKHFSGCEKCENLICGKVCTKDDCKAEGGKVSKGNWNGVVGYNKCKGLPMPDACVASQHRKDNPKNLFSMPGKKQYMTMHGNLQSSAMSGGGLGGRSQWGISTWFDTDLNRDDEVMTFVPVTDGDSELVLEPARCRTALDLGLNDDGSPVDACYPEVRWAMTDGINNHPEWYPGLTAASTFEEFQCSIYKGGGNPACSAGPPCMPEGMPDCVPMGEVKFNAKRAKHMCLDYNVHPNGKVDGNSLTGTLIDMDGKTIDFQDATGSTYTPLVGGGKRRLLQLDLVGDAPESVYSAKLHYKGPYEMKPLPDDAELAWFCTADPEPHTGQTKFTLAACEADGITQIYCGNKKAAKAEGDTHFVKKWSNGGLMSDYCIKANVDTPAKAASILQDGVTPPNSNYPIQIYEWFLSEEPCTTELALHGPNCGETVGCKPEEDNAYHDTLMELSSGGVEGCAMIESARGKCQNECIEKGMGKPKCETTFQLMQIEQHLPLMLGCPIPGTEDMEVLPDGATGCPLNLFSVIDQTCPADCTYDVHPECDPAHDVCTPCEDGQNEYDEACNTGMCHDFLEGMGPDTGACTKAVMGAYQRMGFMPADDPNTAMMMAMPDEVMHAMFVGSRRQECGGMNGDCDPDIVPTPMEYFDSACFNMGPEDHGDHGDHGGHPRSRRTLLEGHGGPCEHAEDVMVIQEGMQCGDDDACSQSAIGRLSPECAACLVPALTAGTFPHEESCGAPMDALMGGGMAGCGDGDEHDQDECALALGQLLYCQGEELHSAWQGLMVAQTEGHAASMFEACQALPGYEQGMEYGWEEPPAPEGDGELGEDSSAMRASALSLAFVGVALQALLQ